MTTTIYHLLIELIAVSHIEMINTRSRAASFASYIAIAIVIVSTITRVQKMHEAFGKGKGGNVQTWQRRVRWCATSCEHEPRSVVVGLSVSSKQISSAWAGVLCSAPAARLISH